MSGAFAYELPFGDTQVARRLIAAVPPNWSWISGQLDAPLQAAFEGKVAGAGYILDRFHDVVIGTLRSVSREAWWRLETSERADISMQHREGAYQLTALRLLPLFVRFKEAGFDQGEHGLMPFELAKRIAMEYTALGYLGDLFFHSDCYDNRGHQNPERCDLHLAPYSARWNRSTEYPSEMPSCSELVEAMRAGDTKRVEQMRLAIDPPKRQYPPLIKVTWETKYGGKAERVASLLDTCKELGLQELDPEPIDFGSSFSEPSEW
jgi:hypothetical protein